MRQLRPNPRALLLISAHLLAQRLRPLTSSLPAVGHPGGLCVSVRTRSRRATSSSPLCRAQSGCCTAAVLLPPPAACDCAGLCIDSQHMSLLSLHTHAYVCSRPRPQTTSIWSWFQYILSHASTLGAAVALQKCDVAGMHVKECCLVKGFTDGRSTCQSWTEVLLFPSATPPSQPAWSGEGSDSGFQVIMDYATCTTHERKYPRICGLGRGSHLKLRFLLQSTSRYGEDTAGQDDAV